MRNCRVQCWLRDIQPSTEIHFRKMPCNILQKPRMDPGSSIAVPALCGALASLQVILVLQSLPTCALQRPDCPWGQTKCMGTENSNCNSNLQIKRKHLKNGTVTRLIRETCNFVPARLVENLEQLDIFSFPNLSMACDTLPWTVPLMFSSAFWPCAMQGLSNSPDLALRPQMFAPCCPFQ